MFRQEKMNSAAHEVFFQDVLLELIQTHLNWKSGKNLSLLLILYVNQLFGVERARRGKRLK